MLILVVLLALTALSAGAYAMGRGKARATAMGVKTGANRPHSLPGYHGSYVALWTGLPAAILLFAFIGALNAQTGLMCDSQIFRWRSATARSLF